MTLGAQNRQIAICFTFANHYIARQTALLQGEVRRAYRGKGGWSGRRRRGMRGRGARGRRRGGGVGGIGAAAVANGGGSRPRPGRMSAGGAPASAPHAARALRSVAETVRGRGWPKSLGLSPPLLRFLPCSRVFLPILGARHCSKFLATS